MELNYKVFGQGEALIILHGLFGTLDNWQTIARRLSDHYSVYIVDQRNHGRSAHNDMMNYSAMAEDLRCFMEEHWIFKASIIGHSMGGKVAMQFALNNPEMLEKLVVIDIANKRYSDGHSPIFRAMMALDTKSIDDRKQADAQLLQNGIGSMRIRQFLLKNLSKNKNGGYDWKMNLPVIYEHYSDILQPVEGQDIFMGPAMFVRGLQSDYVLEEDILDIRTHFPKALLETIPNAGHWVHADAPEELLKLFMDFLAS